MLSYRLRLKPINVILKQISKSFGSVIGSEPNKSDASFKVIIDKLIYNCS